MLSKSCRLIGAAVGVLLASAVAAQPAPTYRRDVEPILRAHCVACHRPDGDAPFSLTSYEDARRHARQMAEATRRGYMPPWKPIDRGLFAGERWLSEKEIATLEAWVAAGAPGVAGETAAIPPGESGWLGGKPDLVLTLPSYALAADGLDVFRNFVVTVPGTGTHYVRGFQFRPNSRAVHHANIRIDKTIASRRLDESDPAPGYEGLILHTADFPEGHFLGWTPGQAPPLGSNELAWRLDGGQDIVVQLHMRPTGRPEPVAAAIGVYFAGTPPSQTPTMVRLGRQNLDIAPGAAEYRVNDSFVLPVDGEVAAIQPHAHYRARQVRAWATLPDGRERSLIRIDDWDFNWQDQYRYASPFWLPAGTRLQMEYVFDNTSSNPRNPSQPADRVSWGWRSSDEMADVWIQLMTRSEDDRETLTTAARRKMTTEDAIGSEVLIAREPVHVSLRNDAALIYMALGQPARALEHFAAVTRLEPGSAAAWYNEGVALEALGEREKARARYSEALRLNPTYSSAHNNLANILYSERDLGSAIEHYASAVRSDPANVEAHCSFARALTETGKPREAIDEYRAALEARSDMLPCVINFSWLLSAHPDAAIRQPQEALQLAERAVTLARNRNATVLDALAAAYAANGRFDEAAKAATEAITAAENAHESRLAADIRERLALYRRRTPFAIPPQ